MYSSCICGVICMSEHVWCHGPSCHAQHTLDRVRGSRGSKVLRTRKVQLHPEYINMYSYFCSNGCYNDFANKYIEQVIAIAPRREPLETPIEVEKVHHPEEQYGNDNRYQWTRQAWTETKITEKQ
jgi:hypothetical protein